MTQDRRTFLKISALAGAAAAACGPLTATTSLAAAPAGTGTILVLFGKGGLTNVTFDFRRPAAARVNLYSWTAGIQRAANDALSAGTIGTSYETVNSSRIAGFAMKDYDLAPPANLTLPTVPAGFHKTAIASLRATAQHNTPALGASTRILLMLNTGAASMRVSDILADPAFSNRSMDVLCCVSKS